MQPEPITPRAGRVTAALEGLKRPALVVSDTDLDPLQESDAVAVRRLDAPPLEDESLAGLRSVLLAVGDVAALRAAVDRLPRLGRVRFVACLVEEADAAAVLRPRPAWPEMVDLDARLVDGAAVTVVRFAARVDAAEVLTELARATAPAPSGHDGVRVRRAPGYDAEEKVPPDVLVRPVEPAAPGPEPSDVLGRAPAVIDPAEAGEPVDEGVFNPIGFRREWSRGVVDLDPGWRPTPGLVAALRDAQGVRVPMTAEPRLVHALAASGVPLVRPGDGIELDDPLRREEHSVRQRRAALVERSRHRWRHELAGRAGVRAPAYPSVSLLLALRRPGLLDHSLRQVAKQRQLLPGAEVELVLVADGFAPDRGQVREMLGDRPHTVLDRPADTDLDDAVRAASDAASGDVVLTLDDDDWYGPDVVTDLLLARRYSGAELVGMPAEMAYLEPIRTTTRLRRRSEDFGDVVAGGTMLLDRSLLRELVGVRQARRFRDAQLLDEVHAAGARIYRTHGLGYLLRDTDARHAGDPGPGDPLGREPLLDQWRGFRPSALLEHTSNELPS